MKRTLILLVATLPLSGCAWLTRAVTPTHALDAAMVGPLILDVCDQHDESVGRDTVLVDAEKRQALRSTEQLRELVGIALEGPKQ